MYHVQSENQLFLDILGTLFYNLRIKSPIFEVFPIKNVKKKLNFQHIFMLLI